VNIKVVVRHFHDGNDAKRKVRKGHSYSTQARLIDTDTGLTVEALVPEPGGVGFIETPAEVWAHCSTGGRREIDGKIVQIPPDVPSRKQGRAIALGRLQKLFPEECAKADFGVFENLRVTQGIK